MKCDGRCCRKVFCDKANSDGKDCHQDIIKMNTDVEILDKDGNKIDIAVPEPEYVPEIFGSIFK